MFLYLAILVVLVGLVCFFISNKMEDLPGPTVYLPLFGNALQLGLNSVGEYVVNLHTALFGQLTTFRLLNDDSKVAERVQQEDISGMDCRSTLLGFLEAR